ncbi:MAG: DUF89 family protein [Oscillospiraceae bacterium]|nr:DUF89 family protein [Oscillospiraceae bacterium]
MQFGFTCAECLMRMQLDRIRGQQDSEKKLACAKEFFFILANAPDGVAAPYLIPHFDAAYRRYFPLASDPQQLLKQRSGEILLERLPRLREAVFSAEDPLLAALQYSRIGNYIDFAAFGNDVDFGKLDALLDSAQTYPVDSAEYACFRRDLETARSFLLVCDNAGEIVLDRLVLEVLARDFPQISLTACVRGAPALNDALREDAEAAGIGRFARIIDNGSAIPGMELEHLGSEARDALDTADVILSKGQANLETMLGCGKNIYYLFLCKCVRFTQMFRVPAMTGMLVNDRRVGPIDILA